MSHQVRKRLDLVLDWAGCRYRGSLFATPLPAMVREAVYKLLRLIFTVVSDRCNWQGAPYKGRAPRGRASRRRSDRSSRMLDTRAFLCFLCLLAAGAEGWQTRWARQVPALSQVRSEAFLQPSGKSHLRLDWGQVSGPREPGNMR